MALKCNCHRTSSKCKLTYLNLSRPRCPNPISTPTLRTRRTITQRLLLIPPPSQLPTQRPLTWQRITCSVKITTVKVNPQTLLQPTSPTVIRETHKSTILIRVQLLRVGLFAHRVLVADEVLAEELLAFGFGDGVGDVGAVAALSAVVAVADGLVAVDVVGVGTETFKLLEEGYGGFVDGVRVVAGCGGWGAVVAGAGNAALDFFGAAGVVALTKGS